MGTDAELPFQVEGMVKQPHHLEAPVVQPEERADRHIVDTGIHGAVHRIQAPAVISLDCARRMQFRITVRMVCLLEHLICADARPP